MTKEDSSSPQSQAIETVLCTNDKLKAVSINIEERVEKPMSREATARAIAILLNWTAKRALKNSENQALTCYLSNGYDHTKPIERTCN